MPIHDPVPEFKDAKSQETEARKEAESLMEKYPAVDDTNFKTSEELAKDVYDADQSKDLSLLYEKLPANIHRIGERIDLKKINETTAIVRISFNDYDIVEVSIFFCSNDAVKKLFQLEAEKDREEEEELAARKKGREAATQELWPTESQDTKTPEVPATEEENGERMTSQEIRDFAMKLQKENNVETSYQLNNLINLIKEGLEIFEEKGRKAFDSWSMTSHFGHVMGEAWKAEDFKKIVEILEAKLQAMDAE